MARRDDEGWQQILEPVPIAEVFGTSVEFIDEGEVWRMIIFADRHPVGKDGPVERVIVGRLVIPKSAFNEMVHAAIRALQGNAAH